METADIIDTEQSTNTSFPVDTVSSSNQITIQSTVDYSGGYCAIKNDALSSNQNIPIGKPVFIQDYSACSKYGWRNFGSKEKPSWDYHHGFDIGCTSKHYGKPVFATANGTTIEIKKGRKTDPNTVKDDSVDPSPFMKVR